TARTGQAFAAAGAVEAPGAIWTSGPAGLLAHTAGEYAVGGRRLRVSLLDARETDAEGTSRRASPGGAAGATERARKALGGWAAATALAMVGLAWMLQRRTD
ncbi:MAG TPA: hypothetical protein VF950_13305, partial [Planctomycetota bacterium]